MGDDGRWHRWFTLMVAVGAGAWWEVALGAGAWRKVASLVGADYDWWAVMEGGIVGRSVQFEE